VQRGDNPRRSLGCWAARFSLADFNAFAACLLADLINVRHAHHLGMLVTARTISGMSVSARITLGESAIARITLGNDVSKQGNPGADK
jgi:hypothetical protein